MFIDQMTLFILAEVAVVYFIITVFLFFRGRLYHVLVAILKEMRWEKLRRQHTARCYNCTKDKNCQLCAMHATQNALNFFLS